MAAGSDDDEPTTSKTSPSKYGSDDEEKEFDSGIVVPSGKRLVYKLFIKEHY